MQSDSLTEKGIKFRKQNALSSNVEVALLKNIKKAMYSSHKLTQFKRSFSVLFFAHLREGGLSSLIRLKTQ